MKKYLCYFLAIALLLSLCGCARLPEPLSQAFAPVQELLDEIQQLLEATEPDWDPDDGYTIPFPTWTWNPVEIPTVPVWTEPAEATEPMDTEPPAVEEEHSELYIPGLSVEDVILYFNEVCLDAEFSEGGDPSLLQKWDQPIFYTVYGNPTGKDWAVLIGFLEWLNEVEGFPGFVEAEEEWQTDLEIYFCSESELLEILGDNFENVDGGVTFWYNNSNIITNAIICYREDIDQTVRNSVILEEIFNGLGPVQDSTLRPDSIIYAGYSVPQELTPVDELLIKLLYHPAMKCGMNAEQCEAVIRSLYY